MPEFEPELEAEELDGDELSPAGVPAAEPAAQLDLF